MKQNITEDNTCVQVVKAYLKLKLTLIFTSKVIMKNEELFKCEKCEQKFGEIYKMRHHSVINHGHLSNSALAIVTESCSLGCDWAPRPRVRKLPCVKQEIVSRKQEKVPILNKKRARTKVCLD